MQVRENLGIAPGYKAPAMHSGFYDKGHNLNNFTKIEWSNERRQGNRKERYMFIRLKCLNLVNRLYLTGKTN